MTVVAQGMSPTLVESQVMILARDALPAATAAVDSVSADRLTDQRTGQAYFTVQLTVDRTPLKDYPDAHIIPGMPVEVAIDTGTRDRPMIHTTRLTM